MSVIIGPVCPVENNHDVVYLSYQKCHYCNSIPTEILASPPHRYRHDLCFKENHTISTTLKRIIPTSSYEYYWAAARELLFWPLEWHLTYGLRTLTGKPTLR